MRRPLLLAAVAAFCFSAGAPATTTARTGPIYCPVGDQAGFNAKLLIGKSVVGAHRTAHRHGCSFRVVRRNGEDLVVTADYSASRINVAVVERRVTRIVGIG